MEYLVKALAGVVGVLLYAFLLSYRPRKTSAPDDTPTKEEVPQERVLPFVEGSGLSRYDAGERISDISPILDGTSRRLGDIDSGTPARNLVQEVDESRRRS